MDDPQGSIRRALLRRLRGDHMSAGDIRYLLDLGLTIDEIARRAGRTPLAITKELEKDDDNAEQ